LGGGSAEDFEKPVACLEIRAKQEMIALREIPQGIMKLGLR
jgi:hypothetical protein